MAEKIQRAPTGILSALGVIGGRYPGSISEEVTPGFSLRDFYRARLLVVQEANSLNQTAVNGNAALTVPAGEVWDIVSIGASWTGMSAGTEAKGDITLALRSGGNSTPLADSGPLRVMAANEQLRFGAFTPGLVIPSGASIRTQLNASAVVGSIDISIRVVCAVYTA